MHKHKRRASSYITRSSQNLSSRKKRPLSNRYIIFIRNLDRHQALKVFKLAWIFWKFSTKILKLLSYYREWNSFLVRKQGRIQGAGAMTSQTAMIPIANYSVTKLVTWKKQLSPPKIIALDPPLFGSRAFLNEYKHWSSRKSPNISKQTKSKMYTLFRAK